MDERTKMMALANSIKEHVEKITKSLSEEDCRELHQESTFPSLDLLDSKSKALHAMHELQALIRGPLDTVVTQALPEFLPIKLVHDLHLATAVPLEEGAYTTYHELAAKSGLQEKQVRCILRSAMLKDIFNETEDGFVIHTPASRLLAEDIQLQAWLSFMFAHYVPSELKLTEAMKASPQSTDPSHSGFAFAHGNQSLYEYLESDQQAAKNFFIGINAVNRSSGFELFHVTQNLPKRVLQPGCKWVDVGGGDGYVMTELARNNDSIHCIVQDLPDAIGSRATSPNEQGGRVTFMAYDFFTPQLVIDADVYFMRQILHDFNDDNCLRILKVAAAGMKPSARLIINDRILPQRGEGPAAMEHRLRFMDLRMRVLLNSQDRDLREWTDLLTTPSVGLEIEEVIRPDFSDLAMFVLRLKSAEA